MKYKTKILQFGNNTGIEVTEEILEQLGGGKKPLVKVTLNGYTYQSAVAKMGDKFLISLSSENRKNANVKGGDELEITIELDTEPRTVALPEDFEKALDKNSSAKAAFEKLAPSKKKAMVISIQDAKTAETKQKRIEKAIESLLF
ncbi:YdeI/OmpD-associated family protein [Emticicia sp. SJ17W-69]|uniref:YdeI/OmpD-associated family protein n=1 Tax=Emticicia sp. SJ17W-69 TaxID=3421657 RepID=UPI003EB70088